MMSKVLDFCRNVQYFVFLWGEKMHIVMYLHRFWLINTQASLQLLYCFPKGTPPPFSSQPPDSAKTIPPLRVHRQKKGNGESRRRRAAGAGLYSRFALLSALCA